MTTSLSRYYLYEIFQSFSFAFVPIYMVFMVERGLSFSQIGLLTALHYGLFFLFEIPTGVIADRFGRKNTLILGMIIKAITLLIAINAWSFWMFALVEALFSLARSLVLGADDAYVYDHLLHHRTEHLYKNVQGKIMSFRQFAHVISGVGGAYLATINLESVYAFSAVTAVIGLFYVTSLKENILPETLSQKSTTYSSHILTSLKIVIRSKELLWLIAYSALIFLLLRSALATLIQPLLLELQMPRHSFSLVDSAVALAGGIIALFAHRVEKLLGPATIYKLFPAILALSFFGIYFFQNKIGILFYGLTIIIWSFNDPIFKDYLNSRITDSSKRATILSVDNMVSRTVFGLFVIFLGFAVDHFGIFNTNLIMSLIAIIGGILLMGLKPKEQK